MGITSPFLLPLPLGRIPAGSGLGGSANKPRTGYAFKANFAFFFSFLEV